MLEKVKRLGRVRKIIYLFYLYWLHVVEFIKRKTKLAHWINLWLVLLATSFVAA